MSKGFASNYRLGLIAFLVFGSFGAIGVRLYCLHVVDRDAMLALVTKARRQITIEPARRGKILDSHGSILAASLTEMTLAIDPWAMVDVMENQKKPAKRAELEAREHDRRVRLAGLLRMSTDELEALYVPKMREVRPEDDVRDGVKDGKVKDRWVKLRAGVDEALYSEITRLVPKQPKPGDKPAAPGALPEYESLVPIGLTADRTYTRTYPHNGLAAHVIGTVNKANETVDGIERSADFYLRGVKGWRESENDGKRQELAQFRSRDVAAKDGYNVQLSLDATVQNIVEDELAQIADKFHPLKATIVVSDPRTGFILALGNYPSYDLNRYSDAPAAEAKRYAEIANAVVVTEERKPESIFKNIATTDVYEPGSVFKIVAASGALEDGLVTPASTFDCTLKSIEFLGKVRNLPAEDKSDHFDRPLTVAEIIAHSSNKGAAQLAMKLGEQKFYDYARGFGFGHRTGFPGGREEPGLMAWPGSKYWDGLTITRMPMGHSVAVTVMQMHQAMSVIASGGVLLRPQIVSQVTDESGETIARFGRAEVRRVVSQRTAQTMAHLLQGVASKAGTAPEAAIRYGDVDYEVAGKTGTTQKLERNAAGKLEYSAHHHVASFVGFFPASNPQVAISVIVDDADAHAPLGVAYGAKTAAPSFKRIGEKLIPYLDIKPGPAAAQPVFALEGSVR